MIDRMKIAYLDEMLNLVPNGGMAVWARRLADYLNQNGVAIDLYSYSDIKMIIPDNIKVFPNLREMFIYPFLGKKILSKLKDKYDLIHLSSPHSLTRHKPQMPILVTIHYLSSRQGLMLGRYLPNKYKVFFNFLSYYLFVRSEAKGLRKADCITVSRQDYKEYLISRMKIPAEKIKVIKFGVDHEAFQPTEKLRDKENMVLFVGRGSLPKGFDTLVGAAKQIKGKIIAVASQIPKSLQRKIEKLDNFKVIPRLSQSEMPEIYKKALVFVMPSLTEGSPHSTLEAMASGLPIVCTTEGSGEYVTNEINGYIIPFKDSDKLAEKVNYLIEHRDVAYSIGRTNRKKVEKELTLQVIASQIKNTYKELIKQSQP